MRTGINSEEKLYFSQTLFQLIKKKFWKKFGWFKENLISYEDIYI